MTAPHRLAKHALVIATMTSLLGPLNLLTSFYGMNVKELSNDGVVSLLQFWNDDISSALSALDFFVSLVSGYGQGQ